MRTGPSADAAMMRRVLVPFALFLTPQQFAVLVHFCWLIITNMRFAQM